MRLQREAIRPVAVENQCSTAVSRQAHTFKPYQLNTRRACECRVLPPNCQNHSTAQPPNCPTAQPPNRHPPEGSPANSANCSLVRVKGLALPVPGVRVKAEARAVACCSAPSLNSGGWGMSEQGLWASSAGPEACSDSFGEGPAVDWWYPCVVQGHACKKTVGGRAGLELVCGRKVPCVQ